MSRGSVFQIAQADALQFYRAAIANLEVEVKAVNDPVMDPRKNLAALHPEQVPLFQLSCILHSMSVQFQMSRGSVFQIRRLTCCS